MWLYISFVEEIQEDCTSLYWLLLQGSQSQQNERNPSTGQEQCGQCSSVGGNKDTMWRVIGAGVLTRTRSFDIIVIFIPETMQKCWFIFVYCVHCLYIVLSKFQYLPYYTSSCHPCHTFLCLQFSPNLADIRPIYGSAANKDLRIRGGLDKRGRYIGIPQLPSGCYWRLTWQGSMPFRILHLLLSHRITF